MLEIDSAGRSMCEKCGEYTMHVTVEVNSEKFTVCGDCLEDAVNAARTSSLMTTLDIK